MLNVGNVVDGLNENLSNDDYCEIELSNSIDMLQFKSSQGFGKQALFKLIGDNSYVVTMSFRIDCQLYSRFKDGITGVLEYTQYEREMLMKEINEGAKDSPGTIKLKSLGVTEGLNDGEVIEVDSADIIDVIFLMNKKEDNTYHSSAPRTPNIIEIPFEPEGNGDDVGWMYGFLKRMVERNVGLTPEEYFDYLAYKFLLERDQLTEEEKKQLFTNDGKINRRSSLTYFIWLEESGQITEDQKAKLTILRRNNFISRLGVLDDFLRKNMGTSYIELAKVNDKKSFLIFEQLMAFSEAKYRFNTHGKYPMYLDLPAYLHICFEHLAEFRFDGLFKDKSLFQFEEKYLKSIMHAVISPFVDEYQAFREEHPTGIFYKKGPYSVYGLGDYYSFYIDKRGVVTSFYKNEMKKVLDAAKE